MASAQLVSEGRLTLTGCRYVDEATAARWMPTPVKASDVLLTSEAPLGRVAWVPTNEPLVLGQRLFALRPIPGVVDSRYLGYWLMSSTGQAALGARQTGSTVAGIRQSALREIEIPVPAHAVQVAVGEVLCALDDKIAVNRRIMGIGDGASRLLARRATANARDQTLGDVAELVTRGQAPRYAEQGFVVLNQKCVRDGRVWINQARTMSALPKNVEKVLRRGDILVNSTGQGTLGRVARWTRHEEAASVDSHVSIVRVDSSAADPDFVGTLMLDREADIEALAEGTTGQTELRRDALSALPIRLPPLAQQRSIGEQLRAIGKLMDGRSNENQQLAATRDELLPLLMSGRITVKDAERRVEEET